MTGQQDFIESRFTTIFEDMIEDTDMIVLNGNYGKDINKLQKSELAISNQVDIPFTHYPWDTKKNKSIID